MSFGTSRPGRPAGTRAGPFEEVGLPRAIALATTGLLTLSFLSVLFGVIDAVGDPTAFYLAVVASLALATALAGTVRVRQGLAAAAVLFVAGIGWYFFTVPQVPDVVTILESNVRLVTGQTLLAMEAADVLALGITPALVLVTWFLTLRRWYVSAAAAGGGTVGYFVLTGDAGVGITLVGIVAAAALIGFGDLDRREATFDAAEQIAAVLAVMVVVPLLVSVVPGGAASPVTFGADGDGNDGTSTIEDNVLTSDSNLEIQGSIELSPEVRFTVESEEPRYWRTGSFDRYTGDGWVRSGDVSEYDESALSTPPGETKTLVQHYEAESAVSSLPAAWRPTAVGPSVAGDTQVTTRGDLQIQGTLEAGETFEIESEVPDPDPEDLETAGTDYPDHIQEQYTQLPESTPDRVGERTEEIIADADNPHEAAVIIEEWLKTNREYSLDVERPEGDIADAVLFEMEAAYCTYYATTMAVMLRTQGIPARMAVGYTPGQQVDDGRWAVRGLDSHAWVEVYYPDIGWVQFDPTPADPRENAEDARLQEARLNGEPNVDTTETLETNPNTTSMPTPEINPSTEDIEAPTPEDQTPTADDGPVPDGSQGTDDSAGTDGSSANDEGIRFDVELPEPPSRTEAALSAIALVGAVAGFRQIGFANWLGRFIGVRYQRRSDPVADIERAHERVLILLESRHRPRRSDETMRQYLDAIDADERARRVAELRERARYAGEATPDAADEAVALVEAMREDE